MQTKGSYSFLLCGMIIACIGFILFIGLLLFHRMHRNYLAGTSLASASSSDASPLISPPSLISYTSAPSNPRFALQSQERRKSLPWWRSKSRSRMDPPERNRKRRAPPAEVRPRLSSSSSFHTCSF